MYSYRYHVIIEYFWCVFAIDQQCEDAICRTSHSITNDICQFLLEWKSILFCYSPINIYLTHKEHTQKTLYPLQKTFIRRVITALKNFLSGKENITNTASNYLSIPGC